MIIIRQFVKFVIIGTTSFVIDMLCYFLFTRFFGFFYILAKWFSFIISAVYNFSINRRWTFRRADRAILPQGLKFTIVASIGSLMNSGGMYLFYGVFHWHEYLSLILATFIVTFWNFLLNKFWTFKQASESAKMLDRKE